MNIDSSRVYNIVIVPYRCYNCTESVGPRVIYRRCSFQNERVVAAIIAPISTQPGIYGL